MCDYASAKPMCIILMRSCFQVSQPCCISNEIQTIFKGNSHGVFYDLFLYVRFNMLGTISSLNITIKNAKCVDHWQPCYCFIFFNKFAVIKIREIFKDIMSFTLNKSA